MQTRVAGFGTFFKNDEMPALTAGVSFELSPAKPAISFVAVITGFSDGETGTEGLAFTVIAS